MLSLTQLFLLFVGIILVVNLLIALIDWKWGRGIVFTAFALMALVLNMLYSMMMLQGLQQNLDKELTEPQGWAPGLGFGIGLAYWYIIEVPFVLGLGIGATLLAVLSRQRRWIIGNAVALAVTVVASLLDLRISRAISAGAIGNDQFTIHTMQVQLLQAHVAFVVVLLALQLLYLAFGVWRIWRSVRLGRRSASATPCGADLTGSSGREEDLNRARRLFGPMRQLAQLGGGLW